jgi:hypothetical protein
MLKKVLTYRLLGVNVLESLIVLLLLLSVVRNLLQKAGRLNRAELFLVEILLLILIANSRRHLLILIKLAIILEL